MLTKSNTMKIERKGKNKSLIKTPSTTTRLSSKKKIELPIKDEKKYIKSIIQILFTKEEERFHDLTTEAISKCHILLRESFGNDPSIVSLREIARFKTCVDFFMEYFLKKNDYIKKNDEKAKNIKINLDETKKLNKIKSIICSIYLCYYIRFFSKLLFFFHFNYFFK